MIKISRKISVTESIENKRIVILCEKKMKKDGEKLLTFVGNESSLFGTPTRGTRRKNGTRNPPEVRKSNRRKHRSAAWKAKDRERIGNETRSTPSRRFSRYDFRNTKMSELKLLKDNGSEDTRTNQVREGCLEKGRGKKRS
jgi:hypothetical protein